jgi:exodeoxyribonuclease V gamma subunit
MPAEDWAAALPRILAGLCPDHPDLPDLGYAIEDWRRAVAAAGIADALPAAVVAAALESRFADLPGAFVRGAVVLAGLRPLRALPFRVVMLLGMDDGAFPRQGRPSADDRLRREPRPGDPDPRHEDRQALLDTLITTRDRLWIAWTGMDPRTGEELPPAPVVGDLLAHAAQVTGLDDDQAATRLVRRHRLLAAQDDPGPAWPAADLPAVAAALVRRPRTVDRCGPCADAPRPLRLDLDTIVRGWLRPDRVWLRRLGVRQVWLDAPPADDEGAPADRDDRRDLAALLVEGSATEADRAIAFGLLPPGPPGALALAALEADLGPLPVRARALREAATRTVLRLEHAGITVAVPVELLPDGPWTWAEDADTPARLRAAVLAILAQAAGHGPGRLITPKPKAAVIRVPAAADPAAALALLLRPWTDPGPVPWHPGAALAIAAGKDPEPVWPADAAARLVWPDPDRPWQHDGFGGLSDAWLPLLAAPADGWVGP